MLHDIIHSYCIKKQTLESQKKLKTDYNSKSYLDNPTKFTTSWLVRLICAVKSDSICIFWLLCAVKSDSTLVPIFLF
jgi:hypothetical protein